MKLQLILSCLLVSMSLSLHAQQVSERENLLIMDFLKAVNTHDTKLLMKTLDKSYRKEQLRFLEGRKTQFINELFSGTLIETQVFTTPKFEELSNCLVGEIQYTEDGSTIYVFQCSYQDQNLQFNLTLRQKGKKYGLVGAVG